MWVYSGFCVLARLSFMSTAQTFLLVRGMMKRVGPRELHQVRCLLIDLVACSLLTFCVSLIWNCHSVRQSDVEQISEVAY